MLRIFEDALALIREMAPIVELLKRKDPKLAEQLRTAVSSIGANIAEGSLSQGKRRNGHYHFAMASAREGLAWLQMAHAWGYIGPVASEVNERFGRIIGVLHKNIHR